MKKISSIEVEISQLKNKINSRLYGNDDVSELMGDIKQNGLLQSIGIRDSDYAIIYGNRRVDAFKKLGYKTIQADVYTDCTDDDLMFLNLSYNI